MGNRKFRLQLVQRQNLILNEPNGFFLMMKHWKHGIKTQNRYVPTKQIKIVLDFSVKFEKEFSLSN